MPGSLRNRLAAYAAAVALLLGAVAAGAVTIQQWQDDNGWLTSDLDFAAFQAAVDADRSDPPDVRGGTDPFVALLADDGAVIESTYPLDPDLAAWLAVLRFEADFESTIFDATDDADQPTVVAATGCDDPNRCSVAVAGATEQTLPWFVADNLAWILLGPLLVAVVVWVGARLLVARSLQPVDEMRVELDTITATDLDRRVPVPTTGDELQKLGASMNQTLERLGRAVAANQRFVADAAHELRSPITGVRAAIEVESSDRDSQLLTSSIEELDRADRLVDDLLVLARHQGTVMTTTDVDLDDIVRSTIASARTNAPAVTIDAELEPIRLRANADALTRIVTNLIDNAVGHGGSRVRVTLGRSGSATGHRHPGPHAVLRVEDDGPGIPPEFRSSIFERFTRLDPSRDRTGGGSGLGLAIVHDLVAVHNGTIAVASSDLGGASFEVQLPLP